VSNITGIDQTDDLLNVKIETKPESGRRKWYPPGTVNKGEARGKDPFSARRRLYALLLHTMYWTRNKLIHMQEIRKKYRNDKLYKMGFMMSKNDIACKMFHRFAYRAMHACMDVKYGILDRYYPIEILHAEERLNYKWFDIELMTEVIVANHERCKTMLKKFESNRLQNWEFVD
jgi:hypothetical protein